MAPANMMTSICLIVEALHQI